ncbi:hypothetical protein [Nitratidesulfovibrio liaohensis]|uniref:hypothetical protein n=1 Tax=Nitratidesulfovibrio liaohensis TaxID=2604158 RepID=UPI00142416BB|nr:hypothetical protein [Nitratidesulfovibrio liaohensis]NHZ46055.1 hypothetical protein [Nitratidesulfovibrio liaohensis]
MATLKSLEYQQLAKTTSHTDVNGTFTVVDVDGEKFLQIDTYGSKDRQNPGKKSQSLRISKKMFMELQEKLSGIF